MADAQNKTAASTASAQTTWNLKEIQDKIMDPKTLQEVKSTLQPVWKVAVDAGGVAKAKAAKIWETREHRLKAFEQWKQEVSQKSVDQHISDWRAKMEHKVTAASQYLSSTSLSKQLQDYRTVTAQTINQTIHFGQEKFHEFEQFSGTALPPADSRAVELRDIIQKEKTVNQVEVNKLRAVVHDQQAKLADVTKQYEAKGTEAVKLHEDMMQFKFLAKDISTAAVEHQEALEDVIESDGKQYLYQAKESAAHTAVTISTCDDIKAGVPYHNSLTGMLTFEHVSSLTFPILDPSTVPGTIGKMRNVGLPTRSSLHVSLMKVCESAGNFRVYLPHGGLLGDLFNRYIQPNDDQTAYFCLKLQEQLWRGEFADVRDRLKGWKEACEKGNTSGLASPAAKKEFLTQLGTFQQKLDVYVAGVEFQRYLQIRSLAHQKSFL